MADKGYRRRWDLAWVGVACAFLILGLMQAQQVLRHFGDVALDLSGRLPGSLSQESEGYLQSLKDPVLLTYFVSREDAMPSHLKEVERQVTAVLEAMEKSSDGNIRVNVIDPDRGGEIGQRYASRHGAAPFKTKEIREDTNEEIAVWSSLAISRGSHRDVLIQGILPSDVSSLEALIVAHLKHQDDPTPVVHGVTAPASFSLLRGLLEEKGVLRETAPGDLDEIDVLFWLSPSEVEEADIRSLHRFVASGRTAVLAGSGYDLLYGFEDGQPVFFADPNPAWEKLMASFGIRPQLDLLTDAQHGPVYVADSTRAVKEVTAPFHLRVMPGYYNLKGFASAARGALNFTGVTPLTVDPAKALEAGFRVEVLGTTTEKGRIAALPSGGFGLGDIAAGYDVGKQNVMLHLVPENPRWGDVIVIGSASVFRDGIINQPNYGHRVFTQTMLRSLSEPHRLVESRVLRSEAPFTPDLGEGARVVWRVVVVCLGPFLLIAYGLRRGTGFLPRRVASTVSVRRAGFALGLIALAGISPFLWSSTQGAFVDLTDEGLHSPLPSTVETLAPLREKIRVRLFQSHRASMPASMKHLERSVRSRLRALGLEVDLIRPESLSRDSRQRLMSAGLSPFTVKTIVDDVEQIFSVWSGLVLSDRVRQVVVPRIEPRHLDHLEFLVATAARRLHPRPAPQVALISEPPRLSPAEAYEYVQQKLTPPKGEDTYSDVRQLLVEYGYRVSYVNPRDPVLPHDADLVVWFQPRRDASKALSQLSDHLALGGRGVIASQHYNVQQRQYRGSGFKTVHWPQPQFQDAERYLNRLGVSQVREVLMDRNRANLQLETQVNRRAVREYESQEVALPFLIRTVRDNYSSTTPVTRKLGDQLFVWGNRFETNPDSLTARGLTAHPLIVTSREAWSFDWKGGWLPDSVFQQPSAGPASFNARHPLALELAGTFPRISFEREESGDLKTTIDASGSDSGGRLVLVGSSEMFKNDHLFRPGYQHEQLFLNIVGDLVYGEDLAALQARRRTEPGFSPQAFEAVATWRVAVIAVGPVLFLCFGWGWFIRRARA